MNITIISSSPRPQSVSVRIALFLERFFKEETEHEVSLLDVRDWLEVFPDGQSVYRNREDCPQALLPLYDIMDKTDAFILVSPEYNGSYPFAMKRLFDHFNKQLRKVFAIATSSTGMMGGMRASLALQHYVVALFGVLSPQMLITPDVTSKFDEEGRLIDPNFQRAVDSFKDSFLWLAETVVAGRAIR